MKKILICIALLILLLVACTSKEEKVGLAAKEHLEKTYHLKDVEVVSVEYAPPPGAFIVFALDYLFNGKNYEVTLQANDMPIFEVVGTVNARELEFKDNDYVSAKHEKLLEEDETYQSVIEQLGDAGIEIITLYDHYFDGSKRVVHFNIDLNQATLPSEELADKLLTMSNMVLENIETTVSLKLSVNEKDIFAGEVREQLTEIEVVPDEKDEHETFIQTLGDQLVAINSVNRLKEVMIEKLKAYYLSVNISRLNHLLSFEIENRDNKVVRHELWMNVLAGYELSDLLEGFKFLQEEGFNDTFVMLTFKEGSTDYCQVKELQTIQDIERCYTNIINPAPELED